MSTRRRQAILTDSSENVTEATWRATDDDTAWFAKHRRRTFRIRRVFPGEFPSPATHVVAAAVEPGVVVKSSIFSPDTDPPNTDMLGETLWQSWGHEPLSKKWGEKVALFRAQPMGNA
ncbi:hypothetical protein J2X36_002111 [Methylobacterium sp. BE186]|uniref:hypothetical protein n=1 Tax=Methylobacterium sp. BE186 TaxID=2817715 RepID=UPI0028565F28|nr:hypothetical protein [Methylobacterium sp. BE186]MDR7037364.1 hypothetical protein [Methylobacterium sp. BE186]